MEEMQTMAMHAGTENSLQVMDDVTITFERPSAEAGNETPLKFAITKDGKPIDNLQIMHDKLMHVVLVRSDLKYFDHVHPVKTEKGEFVVPYNFSSPGKYRIWVDFTFDNMQHIVDYDLDVKGQTKAEEQDRLADLNVEMSNQQIIQGKPTQFNFTITDKQGKPVSITEKFLAADGHLIVIDETLDEFEHAHDETGDKDNVLSFSYMPEKPGKHKAWAQFTVDGKNRVAEFEFIVS